MYCPNGHGRNTVPSAICNICSVPMTVSYSTSGPFILAITAETGCDLKSRRYFQGRIYSDSERDDFGNRKVVIRGSAVEGDWDLFAAAPDLLEFAKSMQVYFDENPDGYFGMREACAAAVRKAKGKKS
jgi:hypothetical protein